MADAIRSEPDAATRAQLAAVMEAVADLLETLVTQVVSLEARVKALETEKSKAERFRRW